MPKIVTSINGRLVEPQDAKISVFDNSLMYAEGLFEMFLGVDDRVIFGDEHLARLLRGAKVIGLDIPVSIAQLQKWMQKTLRNHPARVKKLRMTMTCGVSAKWFGRQGKPQVILSAGPHQLPSKPFRVRLAPFHLDERSILRRIKTLSYTTHAVSLKQAIAKGFDDALLLNNRGEVAEITSANIFWINRGRIYTPPLTSGCLDGITRRIVVREAKRLGLSIIERSIKLPALAAADEVFISSSLKLTIPVTAIHDGSKTHRLPVGPISQQFADHFRQLVGLPPVTFAAKRRS